MPRRYALDLEEAVEELRAGRWQAHQLEALLDEIDAFLDARAQELAGIALSEPLHSQGERARESLALWHDAIHLCREALESGDEDSLDEALAAACEAEAVARVGLAENEAFRKEIEEPGESSSISV